MRSSDAGDEPAARRHDAEARIVPAARGHRLDKRQIAVHEVELPVVFLRLASGGLDVFRQALQRHADIGQALVVGPPAAQDAHDVVGVFLAVLLDVFGVGRAQAQLGHHAVGQVGRPALRPPGGLVVRPRVGVEVGPVALRRAEEEAYAVVHARDDERHLPRLELDSPVIAQSVRHHDGLVFVRARLVYLLLQPGAHLARLQVVEPLGQEDNIQYPRAPRREGVKLPRDDLAGDDEGTFGVFPVEHDATSLVV